MANDPRTEPLAWLVQNWTNVLHRAKEIKQQVFQADADEAMRFYGGRHDFVYQQGIPEGIPPPSFTMTVNRVADLVSRFGPLLYHANPNRRASPREVVAIPPQVFPDPRVVPQIVAATQARQDVDRVKGAVMETLLNWTPGVYDLRTHSRKAIDEALIKGRGVLMTAIYQPPGTPFKVAGSFFESVDNLLLDPDAETLDTATWAAVWCVHPTWQVEREYGLRPGSLRGRYETHTTAAIVGDSGRAGYERQQGTTNTLIGYWKVWSRMGLGTRLQGSQGADGHPLDVFGDNVFLVIAPGVPYPLNLPPEATQSPGATSDPYVQQDLVRRVSWPIPTWVSGHWPFSLLDFRPVPRRIWPMSPVQPGLGELRALDWIYSFIVTRVRKSYRDYLCIAAEAGEDIITKMISGADLEIVKIPPRFAGIKDLVSQFSFPEIKGEIIQVLSMLQQQFNERVGLNELDTGTQLRSATEADYRVGEMRLRSDDYAEIVEAWQSMAARLEAFATRWILGPQDVAPRIGQDGAFFFQQYLKSPNIAQVATDLEYRIESGTVRKPNRDRDIKTITEAIQILAPPLFQYGFTTGDFSSINNLVERWFRARGESAEGLLLRPLPPPPPPGSAPSPSR